MMDIILKICLILFGNKNPKIGAVMVTTPLRYNCIIVENQNHVLFII
jgi:hypothetical protein